MPRIIPVADDSSIDLAECLALLGTTEIDVSDEAALWSAATALKRLCNNRHFLGDLAIAELKSRCTEQCRSNGYSAQSIMLARPNPHFYLRANIWPSRDEYMVRASGEAPFFFDLPHDHNFDFLTAGYWGPGYWSDYYEYDNASVAGYRGEQVDLEFMETSRLETGRIMHYRAHRDVHVQHPADSLSVSLNIMIVPEHQGRRDQYRFDIGKSQIAGILSHSAHDVLMRLAVHLDTGNGRDLVGHFSRHHPSQRVQWSAWSALGGCCDSDDGLLAHYETGTGHRSPLVQGEARRALATLESRMVAAD